MKKNIFSGNIPFICKGHAFKGVRMDINHSRDSLTDVLNALQEEAEGKSNFDPENDFDPEDFDQDDLENDIYSADQKTKIAAIQRAVLKRRVRSNEVAQVDIKIQRLGAAIGASLPFAMFGDRERPTEYRNLLRAPTGYVYDGFTINVEGDMIFSYTPVAPPNVPELVKISCADYPFAQLVVASAFDVFRIRKIRYAISDELQLAQFSEKFEIRERTIFGKDDKNSLSVSSSRKPENTQKGILDINKTFRIDGQTTLVNSIIPIDLFSINLSLFIDKVSRRNANSL